MVVTCCKREIKEAKLEIMTLPLASANTSSNALLISISEGVVPGRSALVESLNKTKTPRFPNSDSFPKSLGQ
jgi:hypothetical protein